MSAKPDKFFYVKEVRYSEKFNEKFKEEFKEEDIEDDAQFLQFYNNNTISLTKKDLAFEMIASAVNAAMGVITPKLYCLENKQQERYALISKVKKSASQLISDDFLNTHGKNIRGLAEANIAAALTLDFDYTGSKFGNVRCMPRKDDQGNVLYFVLVKFDFGEAILSKEKYNKKFTKTLNDKKEVYPYKSQLNDPKDDLKSKFNIHKAFTHPPVDEERLSSACKLFSYSTKEQKINAIKKLYRIDFKQLIKTIEKIVPQGYLSSEELQYAMDSLQDRRDAILDQFACYLEADNPIKEPAISLYPDESDLKHYKGKMVEVNDQKVPKTPWHKLCAQKNFVRNRTYFTDRFSYTGDKSCDSQSLAKKYRKEPSSKTYIEII